MIALSVTVYGRELPIWLKGSRKRESGSRYKTFKKNTLKRDGGCIICGKQDTLIVSHIDAYSQNIPRRLDPTNVVVLCREHDREFNYLYGTLSTPESFFEFLEGRVTPDMYSMVWRRYNGY